MFDEKLKKYNVVYYALYGSQNYECDIQNETYQSDFDYKAICLPSLKNIVRQTKPVSKIIEYEQGEIDVKDIRTFFQTLIKCNPAYVECMITKHWFGDKDFEVARALMPDFVWELRESFIKACYGMMLEKYKALQHPYPSIIERLDKFGYDPKQLHHMLRLYTMMCDFNENGKIILVPKNKNHLIDVKLGCFTVEEAVEVANELKTKGCELRDNMLEKYSKQVHTYDAVQALKEFAFNYVEEKIRQEVLSNG